MAIHKPYDRYIILPPHAKLENVDSLNLQEGQVAIYDLEGEQTENGLKALTNFAGLRKDEQRYVIRVGRNKNVRSRVSNDKAYSTPPFAIDEIIDVYASAPKKDKISVDEVIFGYNGIDDETAITASKGDRIPVHLVLRGRPFELRNYPMGEVRIDDYILFDRCPGRVNQCEECDPCEQVDVLAGVMDFIKRIKEQPIAGGAKVGDFVEITPIHSCTNEAKTPAETPMNFYCIEMCDTGDGYALAQLQAAYPDLDIKRVGRRLSVSKYQVMTEGSKPADYEQKLSSILKGCDECPDGYSEIEGGLIYAVTLQDEGQDLSGTVEGIANAVTSTAKKMDGQEGNTGLYTVVVSKKLTKANIDTFAEANPTATVTFVAKTSNMCENPTISKVSWTACGSCKVSRAAYMITLPDDECGLSAKAQLQEAFPAMEIEDYGTPGGCQHQFKGTVVTSMVCDECDPIFKDFYVVLKEPEPFMGRNWKKLGLVAGDDTIIEDPLPKNCKVGVKFKGIDYLISPSDCLVDKITFEEGSVKIAVQGGYPDEQREAINTYYKPIHTEYKSHWSPRTHIGANLLDKEREMRMFFDMEHQHDTVMSRIFTNEETRLDFLAQYADFAVTIKPSKYSGEFGRVWTDHITFHFFVPYGAHEGIQELMDMLAASAGVKPCAI